MLRLNKVSALAAQGLALGEELPADDTCKSSEEGDCSLELRQLRAHKVDMAQEGETETEPVSFVLPCTEPSAYEGIQLAEVDEQEDRETQDGDDCFTSGVYWREKNRAITMPGTHRTKKSSPEKCQALCAKTTGCGHFSFWSDGGCLLTSSSAYAVKHSGVLSGEALDVVSRIRRIERRSVTPYERAASNLRAMASNLGGMASNLRPPTYKGWPRDGLQPTTSNLGGMASNLRPPTYKGWPRDGLQPTTSNLGGMASNLRPPT